jgi:hypothetical protein
MASVIAARNHSSSVFSERRRKWIKKKGFGSDEAVWS